MLPYITHVQSRLSSLMDNEQLVIVYPVHWIDALISFFRLSVSQSVSQSVCLLTDRLSNDVPFINCSLTHADYAEYIKVGTLCMRL